MKKHSDHNLFSIFQTHRGFTALEIILTMVLIGISSVALIQNWDSSQPATYSAVLQVGQDIRYAQSRAMVTGTAHGFRTLSNTQYEIYENAPGNPTEDPSTRDPMVKNLNDRFPGVQFQGTYQIQFDSLGSPTVGGGTAVSLTKGTANRSLTVANTTGMLQLL